MNNILFIDDEGSRMSNLKLAFQLEGWSCDPCESCKQGVEYLMNKKYDAILLDVYIPKEMGGSGLQSPYQGLQILTDIRDDRFSQWGNGKDTVVVVLTGLGMEEQIKKIEECRPNKLLRKPIGVSRIITTLKEALPS